jgi:hypothetical protein
VCGVTIRRWSEKDVEKRKTGATHASWKYVRRERKELLRRKGKMVEMVAVNVKLVCVCLPHVFMVPYTKMIDGIWC